MLDLTETDIGFVQYRPRGGAIWAVQIFEPFVVRTVDELLTGRARDWLCKNVKGQRFIMRENFLQARYEPDAPIAGGKG